MITKSYEAAVLAQETTEIADEIAEVLSRRLVACKDQRQRASIAAAALGTAAQVFDGRRGREAFGPPVPNGVAARLVVVVKAWDLR